MITKLIVDSGCKIIFDQKSLRSTVPVILEITDPGDTLHIMTHANTFIVQRQPNSNTFSMNQSILYDPTDIYYDNRLFTKMPKQDNPPQWKTLYSFEDIQQLLPPDTPIMLTHIHMSGSSMCTIHNQWLAMQLTCILDGYNELHVIPAITLTTCNATNTDTHTVDAAISEQLSNINQIDTLNIISTGINILDIHSAIGDINGQVSGRASLINMIVTGKYNIQTAGKMRVHVTNRQLAGLKGKFLAHNIYIE